VTCSPSIPIFFRLLCMAAERRAAQASLFRASDLPPALLAAHRSRGWHGRRGLGLTWCTMGAVAICAGPVMSAEHPLCQPMEKVPMICGLDEDALPADLADRPLGFRAAVYQEVAKDWSTSIPLPDGRPVLGSHSSGHLHGASKKVHLARAAAGQKHAGAALTSSVLLGVSNAVQTPGLGAEASAFPQELLRKCRDIAELQLLPDESRAQQEAYYGPIALLQEAYTSTSLCGRSTVLLAVMDNTSRIHGVVRPMMGVISVGDSGFLLLRRSRTRANRFEIGFCTEPQHGSGSQETVQRLAPKSTAQGLSSDSGECHAISQKSMVKCLSTREGDIVILGSSTIFEALEPEELASICNEVLNRRPGLLRSPSFGPHEKTMPDLSDACALLHEVAERIVFAAHAKAPPTKELFTLMDDASVVVAEVLPQDKLKGTEQAGNSMHGAHGGG